MQKSIVVTIDRIEGEYAVLIYKGNEILWPREDLPEGAHESGVLTLVAMTNDEAEKDRAEMAKNVINDLLAVATVTKPTNIEELGEKLDEQTKKMDNLGSDMKR